MLSCRTNYYATVPILYGMNTFLFDQNACNSLPLFLQNLQESTFHSLRRVQIHSDTDNLTHGLDLLVGCVSLESLEIVTFRWPIAKYHKSVLECFRLKSFRVSHIEHKRGRWLQGSSDLIMSDMNRKTNQRQRVEISRQAKVCLLLPICLFYTNLGF
jgi:23S rRNA U2552 (ribose-2'-O)-methylase RlmE/FtsJ